ncbi:MAG: ABC transporter substrate-binding protein [Lachnospiraceae bacterium]|nr:ABC transporter substrate-binding protein [Lachnospiraceae bacterium]
MTKSIKKALTSVLLFGLMALTLAGCGKKKETVTLYGWGGDDRVNAYISDVLAPYVLETTGVELVHVRMDAVDFLAKLADETKAKADSDMDLMWINGENFYSAYRSGLLYGPFTDKLQNLSGSVDESCALTDFGYSTDGYEAPWGKAQFVLFYDSAKVSAPPKNAEELKNFVKDNPGSFTYPVASDFTASAFIRTLLYDLVGYETLNNLNNDYETVKKAIQPLTDYLNEIEPYLWKEGKTYPSSSTQLESLYSDGEILFSMDYSANKALSMVSSGLWPKTTKTLVFDKGTPFNTHFLAIAGISKHKEAAVKVINAALSPEMQIKKAGLSGWADLPVLDYAKLSDKDKAALNAALTPDKEFAPSILTYEELDSHKQPELKADLVDVIEQIWNDTVLNE